MNPLYVEPAVQFAFIANLTATPSSCFPGCPTCAPEPHRLGVDAARWQPGMPTVHDLPPATRKETK